MKTLSNQPAMKKKIYTVQNNISKVNKDKLRSVVLIDMIIFFKHKQDTNTL